MKYMGTRLWRFIFVVLSGWSLYLPRCSLSLANAINYVSKELGVGSVVSGSTQLRPISQANEAKKQKQKKLEIKK